jgi:hypothetical protein
MNLCARTELVVSRSRIHVITLDMCKFNILKFMPVQLYQVHQYSSTAKPLPAVSVTRDVVIYRSGCRW